MGKKEVMTMRKPIGLTALFFFIAAFALGCSSHGERSGAEAGGIQETLSAPSDSLTKAEEDLRASALGEHNKALANLPGETNTP